eukprot:CAMPEP_0197036380 /NCGR_PEP_ID=MMETSP1384-20130603/13903_1 /TAXON_ID=29189 /ORGANISM="Ammonia sp." /LENGTH=651 /DNA_ID=CAMNT_0042466557 /DNA_START=22 /DNA_END=1977 /DNA_ORIENTATION=+
MELPPNPKLKSVLKLCKNQKDVDMTEFFDANQSSLYPTVRHRYNQLLDIVANGIGHLKLFTKHLKNVLDAQQLSANTCLQIVEQYREEEPTLKASAGGFVTMADEAAVTLPGSFAEQKSGDAVSDVIRKTDIDAFTDVFGFERNMAKLDVLYWNRMNSEVYEPLYEYRKACISKHEAVMEYVSGKYDKLVKTGSKLRELKVATLETWNDLCDQRHALRKARANAPDANKTKKQASKVKSLELKAKKLFDGVVEAVDKFNNLQAEFWDEVVKKACVQLEAMEYSRICFYQEYFDKYHELLKWRRAELENGEKTLDRARKMLMTPFEISEYGIHPIRIDHGNYNPIQPQQYELPCMPDEILTVSGPLAEQRIDPAILNPVHRPFGEEIKPSTSRHVKNHYSRASTVIFYDHSKNASMSSNFGGFAHDRDASISSVSSTSSVFAPGPVAGGWNARQMLASQPSQTSFFADNTKQKLFAKTNRDVQHNGGLPAPSFASDDEEDSTTHSPALAPVSPGKGSPPIPKRAPPKASPHSSPYRGPAASPNEDPPMLPPRSTSRAAGNAPALPRRSPQTAPKLPPRRKTVGTELAPRPPPAKSAKQVAKSIRKKTDAGDEDYSANSLQKTDSTNSANSDSDSNSKKKSSWFGKKKSPNAQ